MGELYYSSQVNKWAYKKYKILNNLGLPRLLAPSYLLRSTCYIYNESVAKSRRRNALGFGVNLTGPGTVFTLGFIALAIGMGLLLTRGVTPRSVLSDPGETGDIELVVEPPDPDQKGLQLKTLKFRQCAAITAVTLQIDITGSMGPYINDLKSAVLAFTDPLSDESVLGIQAYNATNSRVIVVPVGLYRDIKDFVRPRILSLTTDGGTPSYDALIFSGEILAEAIPRFPDRKFNFIFFSDGDPNVGPSTEADIAAAAQTIKDQGVTVYAIGLGNVKANIIRAVASDPSKAIIVRNSKELEAVYKQIAQRICQSQATPTPTPTPSGS